MFNNRVQIIGGILIGSSVFLCSILLIIAIYLLYRYQQKTIYLRQNLNDKQTNLNFHFDQQFKKENSNFHQIKKIDEEIDDRLNNQKNSKNNETTPSTVIGELMRKSLQLAKTAEQVADHNEKRFSLKNNIYSDF